MDSFFNILKQRKNITFLIVFILSIILISFSSYSKEVKTQQPQNETNNSKPEVKGISTTETKVVQVPQINKPQLYKVIRVIDGDTVNVEIDGKEESVRLIGIDSPETKDPRKPVQCFGNEASTKLSGILNGKQVELISDETQDDKDKYGRLLRYIFVEDGTNINKFMVEEGYAFEYTYNVPYKYMDEFKQVELVAREKQLGLWAEDNCNGQLEIKEEEKPVESTISQTESQQNATSNSQVNFTTSPPDQSSSAYTCNCAKTCGQMVTCDEAYYQLNNCGCYKRDADSDGVPCESLCR